MSSDSDDDNVIRYGTPLDPYEEDEVPSKKKFQQPTEQYAVDAHGRRRFHGAFTGGFSAGFQNTVGTAEGWTPATFKSSRAEKAQGPSQRPEDFMDDEDRSEYGIAPRYVQTHSEFSGQKRPRQRQFHDGPIPGEPVLEQLVRAVHETAAVKMLRAMGWRPGQGAGERLSKSAKRQASDRHKVYGCYLPPELRQDKEETPQSDEDTDSEYDYETLFAPDDYEPYVLARKSDRFGLGYCGLSRQSVLGSLAGPRGEGAAASHLLMKDKGQKVSIRGQAFGVGAFEADDEDIYATEDMSHYDFAIGGPAPQKKTEAAKKENNVLEGFVRCARGLPAAPRFPPPALPRDFTPAPAGARRTRFEPTDAPQRDQGLGRHELTAAARGALLGETAPKPIQEDPIQPAELAATPTPPIQADPIAKLLGRNVNFTTTTEPEPKELDYIPIKDSGKEITNIFKPFSNNPEKQKRYEMFVKDRDSFVRERDSTVDRLCEWERNRELVEFEQAAKLYRPLTGEMGDRFTHASEPDEGATNPLFAVAKSKKNYGLATREQIEAAEKGVYGVMTRSSVVWRPEALVCKRFNVPDPGVNRAAPQKEDKPKVSYSIFSYLETSVHDKESFAKEQTTFGGSKSLATDITPKTLKENKQQEKFGSKAEMSDPKPSASESLTSEIGAGFHKRMTVAELFLKESEKDMKNKSQEAVTETIEKFDKMDLYKSIFLSDSEEEELTKDKNITHEINFEDFVDVPKNIERNTSPPRGIFANIDFDELNSWKRNAESKNHDKSRKSDDKREDNTTSSTEEKGKNMSKEEDMYGPKIPENIQKKLETSEPQPDRFRPVFRSKTTKSQEVHEILSSSSSDSWVDVKEVKSKKVKKKKNKKHKVKHKKSKHKKKDR